MATARQNVQCELARATRRFGPDHPEVFAARQKFQALKLAETVSTTIPLLSREQIEDIAFGDKQLSAVRPSHVKVWCAKLKQDDHTASYIYVLHGRLKQIMADAVYDGVLGRNPCSTKTSPPKGKAKTYVMTTEQVWALYDVVPEHCSPRSC
jgi:hypothetical protein